jgi:hypothetical protein
MNPSTISSTFTESSFTINEAHFTIIPKEKERKNTKWTKEEDNILLKKAKEFNYKKWKEVANFLPGHSSIQCSARFRRIKKGIVKGNWKKQEDEKLLELYKIYGKNWSKISKEMKTRTGKQIRDRFLNSLDERIIKRKFNNDEDEKIIKLYKKYGNCWSFISKFLKGRTGDMVKNRFYSKLVKEIKKENSISNNKNLNDNSYIENINNINIEDENQLNILLDDNKITIDENNDSDNIINIDFNDNINYFNKLEIEKIQNHYEEIFNKLNFQNE